jgi:MFS family permease
MGLLGLIWAVAGALGPLLGGIFTEFISWRWIFWINLPISGTAFLLLFFFLDVHNPRTPLIVGIKAVDWFGTLAILGLMVMLLVGLDFGGASFPWGSPTVIGLIVGGGCMGAFFLWSEKSLAEYPLIPLGIFRSRSNVACLLIAFFHDYVGVSFLTMNSSRQQKATQLMIAF